MKILKLLPKLLFIIIVTLVFGINLAHATSKEDLEKQIQDLQAKISDLQGQEKTLSSQIAVMNGQISLTELQITSTKQQIQDLTLDIDTATKKIDNIEGSLDKLTKVLINRVVATYEVGSAPSLQALLTSSDINDFVKRANYLKLAQAHDKRLIYDTVQAKNDYANQKNIFEDQKKEVEALKVQLEDYSAQLDQEKSAKADLLAQTQGSEASYQSLLAQAQRELAGFASFADTQGGGALGGQTSCDGWGCYYNQRDSQWAGILINGQGSGCNGSCTILRVGCLVTSVAMMASNKGHRDISPADVATSGNQNFSAGTADLRKGTISVKGINITRTTIAGSLDPSLVQDGPVIVGFYYGPFGTHFVVIKSYTNGQYIMNDPYTAGGKDKNFSDYYSLGSIFEVDRVSM